MPMEKKSASSASISAISAAEGIYHGADFYLFVKAFFSFLSSSLTSSSMAFACNNSSRPDIIREHQLQISVGARPQDASKLGLEYVRPF